MGIHVTRNAKNTAPATYVSRPGERQRPAVRRPGTTGGSGKKGPATGGGGGTRGDFGADFE